MVREIMYDLSVYNAEFFSTNQAEGLRHAEWFCPLIVEIFHPKSLVDVGCGTGHFVKWCDDHDIEAFGIEGSVWAVEHAIGKCVIQMDLRQKGFAVEHCRKFDLAISIEVAEHIEKEYAGVFVDTLCALSDTVVMTAAPPGQGGTMHVNEQEWPYWRDLFSNRHYYFDAVTTGKLKDRIRLATIEGHHVATWFAKNIMVWRADRAELCA